MNLWRDLLTVECAGHSTPLRCIWLYIPLSSQHIILSQYSHNHFFIVMSPGSSSSDCTLRIWDTTTGNCEILRGNVWLGHSNIWLGYSNIWLGHHHGHLRQPPRYCSIWLGHCSFWCVQKVRLRYRKYLFNMLVRYIQLSRSIWEFNRWRKSWFHVCISYVFEYALIAVFRFLLFYRQHLIGNICVYVSLRMAFYRVYVAYML